MTTVRIAEPADMSANLAVFLPDGMIAVLLVLAGVFFESPILLALAFYATLILARDVACIVIRRHGKGQNAHQYEFGTSKLEQAVNLVLAAIKIAAGLWLAYLVLGDGHMMRSLPTQGELGFFALVSALYTIRCVSVAWSDRGKSGQRFKAIGSSARTRLLVAISLQTAFTISAIAKDAVMIGVALSAGMLLLAFALFMSGMKQSRSAVLDLIDHPPDSATGATIQAVVSNLEPIDQQMIVDIRARRSGQELFVELTVTAEPKTSLDEIRRRLFRLRDKFTAALPGSDVVVRLSSAPIVSASGQR